MATRKLELLDGFVDDSGVAHKNVVLRSPQMSDEFERDRKLTLMRAKGQIIPKDGNFELFALILECIESWDGLVHWNMQTLASLSRRDGRLIVQTFAFLDMAPAFDDDGQLTEAGK